MERFSFGGVAPIGALAVLFALLSDAGTASAALPTTPVTRANETFSSLGAGLTDRAEAGFAASGLMRTRLELRDNFDLDHGLGPSGKPLWPVPLSDPTAQLQTNADMRMRLDLTAWAPGGVVAVHSRLDLLDNISLGGSPNGPPTAATGQSPSGAPLTVRRLWAEALLPFGVLAAGRMGSHWGLGLLTNGGDCHDCDSGDAADRVALVVPAAGFIWALAYDFSAIGPTVARGSGSRRVDLDPADDVRTVTFAVLDVVTPAAKLRRHGAGRGTFEGGVWGSHRRQAVDVPASWLLGADAATLDRGQVVQRDFTATAGDLWLRYERSALRLELEAALLTGSYGQSSLLPGVEMRDGVEALQWAVALQSRVGHSLMGVSFGLDLGAASGDPAPGFGVEQPVAGARPLPGDLDGAQASPPRDNRLDNFRLHPDARIDRILFREIVGTVTDATWARPHVRWAGDVLGDVRAVADLAVVASWAMEPNSTPSGARALGVEIDPTLSFSMRGLLVEWQAALLLPGAGLDNSFTGAKAQPAWMSRLFLGFAF